MDSELVIPTVTAKDRERARDVVLGTYDALINKDCPCEGSAAVPGDKPPAHKCWDCLSKWIQENVAHALASQREADARVAETFCSAENHQWQPEKCKCAKVVATAIRRGWE